MRFIAPKLLAATVWRHGRMSPDKLDDLISYPPREVREDFRASRPGASTRTISWSIPQFG